MKVFTLAFAIFILPIVLFAQSNYKPGYIVNLNGDTVKGFIDYKGWSNNPKNFVFVNSKNDHNPKEYSPKNIGGFGIDGNESYERYILKISLDKLKISELSIGPDTISKLDTVFLQVLKKGRHLSLFSFTDFNKTRFYIKSQAQLEPRELIYKRYLDPVDNKRIIEKNVFIGQLMIEAKNAGLDNSKLTDIINSTKYQQSDLIYFIDKFNGVSSSSKGHQAGIRFIAGLGFYDNSISPISDDPSSKNFNASTSVLPKITFGIDRLSNIAIGNFLFRVEGSLSVNKYSFESNTDITVGTYKISQKVTEVVVGLNPQVIYYFYNGTPIKIFIGAGICLNYYSYPDNNFTVTASTGATDSKDHYLKLNNFTIPLTVKTGVVLLKKFELYFGYQILPSIDNSYSSDTPITSFAGGINFLFGR